MVNILSKEIIFEARIEFGYSTTQKNVYLVDDSKSSYDIIVPTRAEVSETVSKVISVDLPHDLKEIYGINIKPRIITTRPGSLQLFFAVMLTGYSLIGGYKSFFDSIDLIKQHTNSLIRRRLRDRFDFHDWDINIESRYPSINRLRSRKRFKELLMKGDIEDFEEFLALGIDTKSPIKKRDGFFYYLLISNCILIIALGFFVYSAVQKTYFP